MYPIFITSACAVKLTFNPPPFGMQIESRSYTSGDKGYRFAFNGKEKDVEGMGGGGATYDYGFRIYNGQLGKFLSVDPMAPTYRMLSPYQFASNTPIQAIDRDGLEAWVVIWASQSSDANGKNRIGHAGIVVKNYKTVETTVTKVRYEWNYKKMDYDQISFQEIVTTYDPTGTYTYYDLWPDGGMAVYRGIDETIASYQSYTFTPQGEGDPDKLVGSWLIANDISAKATPIDPDPTDDHIPKPQNEGYIPDGVVRLDMTPAETFNVENQLKKTINSNQKYDLYNNNCVGFVCNAIAPNYKVLKELNTTIVASLFTGRDLQNFFYTPNKTYNTLENLPKTTIIKDAGSTTEEDLEDAMIDPNLGTFIRQ